MKSDLSNERRHKVALARFACVSRVDELVRRGVPFGVATQEVANRPPVELKVAARTLEDWFYLWRREGFKGLLPKTRRDRGQCRSISQEQSKMILQSVEGKPQVPLKTLYRHWIQIDATLPSLNTIYRFLVERDLGSKKRRNEPLLSGPTKAFESPLSNDLWMVDFSPGPFLKRPDSKKSLATQLCLIIDDHSRLIPYAAYYSKANTATFHQTLKEAVLRRGVPHKLYTDQGAPFVYEHSKIACAALGIRLLHAKPYHNWSKGKVERMFLTLQKDFESALGLSTPEPTTIEELNAQLALWLHGTYHCQVHSSTAQTPADRFSAHAAHTRALECPEGLEELFYMRLARRVRKDATVRLDNQLYEVDLSLRTLQVELRFDPLIKDPIQVFHKGRFCAIATPVDLQLNSQLNPQRNYEKRPSEY